MVVWSQVLILSITKARVYEEEAAHLTVDRK